MLPYLLHFNFRLSFYEMSSLSAALVTEGLEKIINELEELGVESSEDLKLLDNDTIQELKFNVIQKKKLNALVEKLQSSVQEGAETKHATQVLESSGELIVESPNKVKLFIVVYYSLPSRIF